MAQGYDPNPFLSGSRRFQLLCPAEPSKERGGFSAKAALRPEDFAMRLSSVSRSAHHLFGSLSALGGLFFIGPEQPCLLLD